MWYNNLRLSQTFTPNKAYTSKYFFYLRLLINYWNQENYYYFRETFKKCIGDKNLSNYQKNLLKKELRSRIIDTSIYKDIVKTKKGKLFSVYKKDAHNELPISESDSLENKKDPVYFRHNSSNISGYDETQSMPTFIEFLYRNDILTPDDFKQFTNMPIKQSTPAPQGSNNSTNFTNTMQISDLRTYEGSNSSEKGLNELPEQKNQNITNSNNTTPDNNTAQPRQIKKELTEQTIKNFLKEWKGIDGESIAVYPAQYGSDIWAIKGKFANGSDFSYESEFKDHSDMESKLTTILNRSLGSKDYSFPIDRNLNYYRQYYTTK